MRLIRMIGLTCCTALLFLGTAQAQGGGFPNARWKAEEQKCIAACPPFPRFSGTETDAQYQRRIKAENAYNRCYATCTKQYEDRVNLPYKPFDDGSQGYLKRNQ
jgi:hypothetical protein